MIIYKSLNGLIEFKGIIKFKNRSINFLWVRCIIISMVVYIIFSLLILNFILFVCSFTKNAHSYDQNIADINKKWRDIIHNRKKVVDIF